MVMVMGCRGGGGGRFLQRDAPRTGPPSGAFLGETKKRLVPYEAAEKPPPPKSPLKLAIKHPDGPESTVEDIPAAALGLFR
jgi:hypothetical protein